MSQINSNNPVIILVDLWFKEKEKAIKTGDWELYKFTLENSKKGLMSIYANGKNEWFVDMIGKLIKTCTCELHEINIKYKKI